MQDPDDPIEFLNIDILEEQGWERHIEFNEETSNNFEYWTLRLPRDNPDPNPPYLVTNRSDDDLEDLEPGEFVAEISNFYGLGFCETRDDVENLYFYLTGVKLSDHLD